MDHCFLESKDSEESAHENPFLVLYGNETEAIFAIAVSTHSTAKPWIVEYVKNIIHTLGYGELKIATKCNQAKKHA